jgi:hypothetical protein
MATLLMPLPIGALRVGLMAFVWASQIFPNNAVAIHQAKVVSWPYVSLLH